jgi:redox-sensitive bicupin YhaK (pirin superfamily)
MLTLRKASERGHADHGWLDTWHTFSFADYYDPAHHNFRVLRVMNDDKVAAGQGFGTHPHRDMEIVTYVLEGELAHKDSMGHQATLTPGRSATHHGWQWHSAQRVQPISNQARASLSDMADA